MRKSIGVIAGCFSVLFVTAQTPVSKKQASSDQKLMQLIKTKSDVNGQQIDPGTLKGNFILLGFCGDPANPELQLYKNTLLAMQKKIAGLHVIRVSQLQGDFNAVKPKWANSMDIDDAGLTQLLDNENVDRFSAAQAYGVNTFPTSLLLDEKGTLIRRFSGNSMDSLMRMFGVVTKATMSGKNQLEMENIQQADQLFKKFEWEAAIQTKLGMLRDLDLKNPYTPKLMAMMQGHIAARYAAANDLLKARQFLSAIQNTQIRLKSTVALATVLADQHHTKDALSFILSALDSVLAESPRGQINLDKVNLYGGLAQLYTRLTPLKGNEKEYIKYLKPVFQTCKFFPSDAHSLKDQTPPALESLLVYHYAMALAVTGPVEELAKAWAAYLHAEPEPGKRLNEVLKAFSYVDGLANQLEKVKATGNEANYEKLFKIALRPDINGKVWGLNGLQGKYLLVDFWASWCGPCRASHPHLKEVYAKYKGKGLEMIGIASENSSDENMMVFTCKRAVQQDGANWIQLLDENRHKDQFAPLNGDVSLVKKMIFDKEGKCYGVFQGKDAEGLDKKLAELMP